MAHVNGITQFTTVSVCMCVCQFGTLLNLAKRLYSLKGRLIWAQETIIIWGEHFVLGDRIRLNEPYAAATAMRPCEKLH